MTTLDAALEQILDQIRDTLEAAANETGGELNEVLAVVRGDRARPLPDLPALFVVPQPATYESVQYGREERWTLDVSIAALVNSDDPETGHATALRLAARARAVALTVRGDLDFVYDVTSRSFDPYSRRSETNRNLYWTDAVVRVAFDVTD